MIKTDRLILRQWKESDLEIFAKLTSDSKVMEFFPSILDREQSDVLAKKFIVEIETYGYGLWAVEVIDGPSFIGFVGIRPLDFDAHFTPAHEIGWRLLKEHWGKGYAQEAARAALKYGFEILNLDEIVAITYEKNLNSQRVMQRLNMTCNADDNFNHPKLSEEHPLARHVLYRLSKSNYLFNM